MEILGLACSLFPISPGRVPGGGLLSPPGSVSRLETSGSPLVLVSASKSGPLGLLRLLLPGRNCACSPAIRVGDAIHAHVGAESFDAIVNELISEKVEVKN